jgi:hypothetical protein
MHEKRRRTDVTVKGISNFNYRYYPDGLLNGLNGFVSSGITVYSRI